MGITAIQSSIATLKIYSPAFDEGQLIPSRYTCDGYDINPPLVVENIPEQTKSLVLILEDPDTLYGVFDHWIVWNIRPLSAIRENSNPGIVGRNSAGEINYCGPCPAGGLHRYFFRIFALDSFLLLPSGSEKKVVEEAMSPHILSSATTFGRYIKNKNRQFAASSGAGLGY